MKIVRSSYGSIVFDFRNVLGRQRKTSVQNSLETRVSAGLGTEQGRRAFPNVGGTHREISSR